MLLLLALTELKLKGLIRLPLLGDINIGRVVCTLRLEKY